MAANPDDTAATVIRTLGAAGFPVTGTGSSGRALTAGLYAADLPLSSPRVAIYCSPPELAAGMLAEAAGTLRYAGYQAERVVELTGEYLVVWTEGES